MMEIPPELMELADQALESLQRQAMRQLGRLTDKAVDKAADVAVWLKSRLTGAPKAVLDELEKDPQDETNVQTLRLQLRKLLAEDEQFREQLCTLLSEAGLPGDCGGATIKQRMETRGNGNINIQAGGDVSMNTPDQ